MELGDDSCSGAFDVDCDFIGLNAGYGLILFDPLALLLDEFSDSALVDGVSEEGKWKGLGCVS